MKKLLIAIAFFTFMSCTKDKDEPTPEVFNIVGTWRTSNFQFTLTSDRRYNYEQHSEWTYTEKEPFNVLVINTNYPYYNRMRFELKVIDNNTWQTKQGEIYKRQ